MFRAEPIFRWSLTIIGVLAAAMVVSSSFVEYWKLGSGPRAWGIADSELISARWASPVAGPAGPGNLVPGVYIRRRGAGPNAGAGRPLWISYAGPVGVTVSMRSITLVPAYPIAGAAVLWSIRLRRVPPGHCKHCRYDLRGIAAGSPCPECGHSGG